MKTRLSWQVGAQAPGRARSPLRAVVVVAARRGLRALPCCAQECPRSETGFTLIELVISGSLMALILVSGYLCLSAALSSQKLIEPRVEILQNARVAMNLMAADLRAACPLDKQFDLLGMSRKLGEMEADNLDFATHNYTPRHPNEAISARKASLWIRTWKPAN